MPNISTVSRNSPLPKSLKCSMFQSQRCTGGWTSAEATGETVATSWLLHIGVAEVPFCNCNRQGLVSPQCHPQGRHHRCNDHCVMAVSAVGANTASAVREALDFSFRE